MLLMCNVMSVLLKSVCCSVLLDKSCHKYPGVMDFVLKLYNANNRSPHLLAFLIDLYEEMLEDSPKDEETLHKAVKVSLSMDTDTVVSGTELSR